MSAVTEIINIDEMVGRTLIDGKVVAEYKVENCDNCQHIRTLDKSGYQYNVGGEPILWFCVEKIKAKQCPPAWQVLGSDGQWRPQV